MKKLLCLTLLFFASVMVAPCQAAVTLLKVFNNTSTAGGTICSVMGSEKTLLGDEYTPAPASGRLLMLGTKNRGYKNYSTSISSGGQIHISCYNGLTLAPTTAMYYFDSYQTILFPVTEKYLKIR